MKCYSPVTAAKSAVGRGNPENIEATTDAYSVFFIVEKSVPLYSAAQLRTESMVALAGQLSGWPVSFVSGISTPVSVITNQERGNSGGDSLHTKEAAKWLLPSPKLHPHLSGSSPLYAAIPRQSNPSCTTLRLFPNWKPAAPLRVITSVSSLDACQLWGGAVSNLQNLVSKARAVRGDIVGTISTKGSRTKTPVYERDEQRKLRERIQQTQPDWVLLWWDISVVTGWRTADVCNLRYSNIDWETGKVTITVAKQTKAAEARAVRKGIEIVRQQRKDAARIAADHIAYMNWDSASCDELAADMNESENQIVFELVGRADVKYDTKQFPPGLIKRLRERQECNLIDDDLVFSRSQIESNRCQSLNGSVTRQTIWRKLQGVMSWFTTFVNSKLRLSAYSSRKIAAYNLMVAGGDMGLLVASEMLGHSNPAITRTYLQLGSKAAEIQSEMAAGMFA